MPIETAKFWDRVSSAFRRSHNTDDVVKIQELLELKSKQAVYRWRKYGKIPEIETMVKIADLTRSSLHWLITGKGPAESIVVESIRNGQVDVEQITLKALIQRSLSTTSSLIEEAKERERERGITGKDRPEGNLNI